MRSTMSHESKRQLLSQTADRYRAATRAEKSVILDEFVAATGYARKYAIRLLNDPPRSTGPIRRSRSRKYGREVQEALQIAWAAANFICAKRLVPFLPELVSSLERHGHLVLADDVRCRLLELSAATADRLLAPLRTAAGPRGVSTTISGKLLKQQVPVRTFADWDDASPGFLQADSVAHCGPTVKGSYVRSLVLTDVATDWTERMALPYGGEDAAIRALDEMRSQLPFPMLGLDTDNGTEFLNNGVIKFCRKHEITFTRGRPYKKNDQCYVEQKNGSIVRQIVGYDRYEGPEACRQLDQLYRAVRLYVNAFQPSMKLITKTRSGPSVHRTYDTAQTPFRRLVGTGILDPHIQTHLEQIVHGLDPIALQRQVQKLQDRVWAHAIATPFGLPTQRKAARPSTTRFSLAACMSGAHGDNDLAATGAPSVEHVSEQNARRHRRAPKKLGPRMYRTRADPFAEVRTTLRARVRKAPASVGARRGNQRRRYTLPLMVRISMRFLPPSTRAVPRMVSSRSLPRPSKLRG